MKIAAETAIATVPPIMIGADSSEHTSKTQLVPDLQVSARPN